MKDNLDLVCNEYCREVTLEHAMNLWRCGRTIEVRIYNEKDQIKYWEKYNAQCEPRSCISFEELLNGRFFVVVDEGP